MAKAELATVVEPKCRQQAEALGYELVDACLDKEDSGKYLRLYIDSPEGITLDDCERYHRAIQPQLESYDYDFLEVSSPGIDRPLKKDRDYERALGLEVEVHLYKPLDGAKIHTGELVAYDAETLTILCGEEEKTFVRRQTALVKPVVDMEGVEDVDMSDAEEE